MHDGATASGMTRRGLLRMIGMTAGSAAMYQAVTSLGLAAENPFNGTPDLGTDPKGASVLLVGAGIADMVAAFELSTAGYAVQLLEYNARAGGRIWTLRSVDTYTEMGGETQTCGFDPYLYINPGPWRLPYHHRCFFGYCKQLGGAQEPFIRINYSALLHSQLAFDGKLDAELSKEDQQNLLDSLQWCGALEKDYKYTKGTKSGDRRGYAHDRAGGLKARLECSSTTGLSDLLDSGLWQALSAERALRHATNADGTGRRNGGNRRAVCA